MEKTPEEISPEPPTKKKRAFTWTEKRKEAWAKAQAARANNIEVRKEAKKQPPEPVKRVVRRYVEVSESEDEKAPVFVKKSKKPVIEPESSSDDSEPPVIVRKRATIEPESESESEIEPVYRPPSPQQMYV